MAIVTHPVTGAKMFVPDEQSPGSNQDQSLAIEQLEKRVLGLETRVIDLEAQNQAIVGDGMDIEALVENMRDKLLPQEEDL